MPSVGSSISSLSSPDDVTLEGRRSTSNQMDLDDESDDSLISHDDEKNERKEDEENEKEEEEEEEEGERTGSRKRKRNEEIPTKTLHKRKFLKRCKVDVVRKDRTMNPFFPSSVDEVRILLSFYLL